MRKNPEDIRIILATDCGSTTSKARFFMKVDGEYRYVASGEAPTTVEAPYENVTLGVRNAVKEVEELTGHTLQDKNGIITSAKGKKGVDLYVTTSSAGGGLQMMVSGLIRTMTAESAERAALGAGAIVMDVFSMDDGREPWEKIERIRFLRPDMILHSGGVDGGNISQVIELTEFIRAANPSHRLGEDFHLPIVYAGNVDAREHVKKILGDNYALEFVDNIRPILEVENTGPAREAIHQLFMEHVMSHAPGYPQLMKWTDIPIMPTPAGEGTMFRTFANAHNVNLIGVGLGGATTNVYSIYEERFVRSVSANLGMSYSICNVLKETGLENIMRWLPFEIDRGVVLDRLRNKMIRPTTIPQTLQQLIIEHSVAREALRLGLQHHKLIARPLLGGKRELTMEERMGPLDRTQSYIDMRNVNYVGGTGGLLSHAPRRVQPAIILIDGFGIEGIVRLFQDSVFMIPHLGVLSTVHQKAALEIFEKDCLVRLGTCIAFRGKLREADYGKKIAELTINMPNGETIREEPEYGTIKRIPLAEGEVAEVEVSLSSGFSLDVREQRKLTGSVEGGVVGLIIDARGRPLELPSEGEDRRRKLIEWFSALDLYPKEIFK